MDAQLKLSRIVARIAMLAVVLVALLACQAQPQATQPPQATSTTETASVPATETPGAEASNTIRITNGEWPPYLSETLAHHGLASRIITEAFASQGVTVEYGFFPWPRALELAREGTWDGSAVWFKNEEREQEFYIGEPVIQSQYVFFHLKDNPFEWEEMEDLADLRIGATLEYDYGEAFTEAEESGQIKVERIASDEQNFTKLLGGRIDIFPLDLEVGLDMLRQNFTPEEMAQITYHPLPVRSDPLYLLLSKKVESNAEMVEIFNAGMAELEASGQLEQFIEESREGGD